MSKHTFNSLTKEEQRHFVIRMERQILNGEPTDAPIDSIPSSFTHRSPVLLQAYGIQLLKSGELPQAKEMMIKALKGFTEITLQKQMLSTMSQLAVICIQLGQLLEAKELLRFIHSIWTRQDEEITGDIPYALGTGSELLDVQVSKFSFYDEAIHLYIRDGAVSKACEVWFDKLIRSGIDLSDQQWDTLYRSFQHYVQLHQADNSLCVLAKAHRATAQENWTECISILERREHLTLDYPYTKWLQLLLLKAKIATSDIEISSTIIKLEKQNFSNEMNMELRAEWLLLKAEWHISRAEWDKVSELITALEELSENALLAYAVQGIVKIRQRFDEESKQNINMSPSEEIKSWKVYCFAELRFIQNGREVRSIHWKRRKSKELLVYLLLQPQFSAHREQVAEDLFTEVEPHKVANQMYVAISQMKQSLKEYLNIDQGISIRDGIIRLNEEAFEYADTEHYVTLVRVGNQLWSTDKELAVEMLEKAVSLYDRLVPDILYLDWLDRTRDQLLEQQAASLNKLGQYEFKRGNLEHAESYFIDCLTLSPLEEVVYQQLMKLLNTQQRYAEADKWYRRLEQLCREEMGLEPLLETKRLLHQGIQY